MQTREVQDRVKSLFAQLNVNSANGNVCLSGVYEGNNQSSNNILLPSPWTVLNFVTGTLS